MSRPSEEDLQRKVLRSLQAAIACCDPVPELPHFRRPPAKIPTRTLFSDFIDEEDCETWDFVVSGFPWGLPSVSLISMDWQLCTASHMTIQIDQETSLYFEYNDAFEHPLHFLAVAERTPADMAHESFVREVFRTNGQTLNTGAMTSPPSLVHSRFPKPFLVEMFLLGAEPAIEWGGDDFWAEVLEIIESHSKRSEGFDFDEFDESCEVDRRRAIDAYVEAVATYSV